MADYYSADICFPMSALEIEEINACYAGYKIDIDNDGIDENEDEGLIYMNDSEARYGEFGKLEGLLIKYKIAYERSSSTYESEAPYKVFYDPRDGKIHKWLISETCTEERLAPVDVIIRALKESTPEKVLEDLEKIYPALNVRDFRGGWEGILTAQNHYLEISSSMTLYINANINKNEVKYQFKHDGELGLIHATKMIRVVIRGEERHTFFIDDKQYWLHDFIPQGVAAM